MPTPKFVARIISSARRQTPTQEDRTIGVNIAGRKLIVQMTAQTNPLDQDSFRIDVDRRGYVTPVLDITDLGEGNWVVNVYDDTGAKYQVRTPNQKIEEPKDPPCREGCDQGLFKSSDRTMRCRGCHLYPDQCNCPPEVKLRILSMMGLVQTE